MSIASKVARFVSSDRPPNFGSFAISLDAARARRTTDAGPLEDHFLNNTGRLAHKWHHFLPIYDRILAPMKSKPVYFLELGVSMGGSLEMWRRYFGPEATIYGVDINPDCADRVDAPNQVRIGSQADPSFLREVVAEMGGSPDVILDDGSHVASHQRVSFLTLWPLLKIGGLYIIEDLHTAYWPNFEGGYRKPGTAVEMVKGLIDDLHGFYHGRGETFAPKEQIGSIQVFDSVVVIEKAHRLPPRHVKSGGKVVDS